MGVDTRPLSVLDSEQHPGCWDDSASSPAFPRICSIRIILEKWRNFASFARSFHSRAPYLLISFFLFLFTLFSRIRIALCDVFPSIVGIGEKKILSNVPIDACIFGKRIREKWEDNLAEVKCINNKLVDICRILKIYLSMGSIIY